jgi:hypothetical protein
VTATETDKTDACWNSAHPDLVLPKRFILLDREPESRLNVQGDPVCDTCVAFSESLIMTAHGEQNNDKNIDHLY